MVFIKGLLNEIIFKNSLSQLKPVIQVRYYSCVRHEEILVMSQVCLERYWYPMEIIFSFIPNSTKIYLTQDIHAHTGISAIM
jgi:hypothetical protein